MERKNSNEKEIQQLKNRFRDLAEKSFRQGIFTFTGFLGLSEQDVFWQEERGLSHAGYCLGGGYDGADRVMIRFGDSGELGYEVPFPIVCIHIQPLAQKFADELSHRDFLGALMNLGIERSTIGDIKAGERQAYLFCQDSIAAFICENLRQVKHTHVKCAVVEDMGSLPEEEPLTVGIQVQSMRVDGVLAKVYNMSREKSLDLFRAGKVYVNGRLCENNSRQLETGETVNARGYGKFVLTGRPRETRKGKLAVEVAVYQ
ncbi:YlmH/Sll1252 family protein [uncultured Acetatifactor sp.]|uniref:YlmH/Sll1252 family protein n=1 Tax=uncultured Acetatifactor sp. TaxID=1671927 RepID=UPI0026071CDF|nr:YlmH/Sll1252 family protein [uncultured Acetatifactor sp.]